MFNKNFTEERLADVIKSSGMADSDIAIATGIAVGSVSSARKGSQVSMENIIKLADFFNVSLDYLFGRVNEKDTDKFFSDRKLFLRNVYTRRAVMEENVRKKLNKERWDYNRETGKWDKSYAEDSPYFKDRVDSFIGKVDIESATYPENLLLAVFDTKEYDMFDKRQVRFFPTDDDVVKGIEYVLSTLTEREQKVIKFRYEDNLKLEDAGKALGVTRERVRQIEVKVLRKMRHPKYAGYLLYGIRGYNVRNRKKASMHILYEAENAEKKAREIYKSIDGLKKDEVFADHYDNADKNEIAIDELELSVRSYNCLKKRGGITTLGELHDLIDKKGEEGLLGIRNLGRKSQKEVLDVYYKYYGKRSAEGDKR